MWLPNALPVDRLKSQFDFVPSQQWLDHLRLSSVHIGASGSFISPDGLILTNHHVALDGLHNISDKDHDYVASGFLAKSLQDEVKLPGEEVNVLVSIEDVTDRVNSAIDPRLSPDDAVKARHAVFADIERESLEKTGYYSNVVTLYGGALYHLYRYKRYTDIRLVFAPEYQAAFFGGDPDNFEYPRYCLDIALLRAYEDGKPAHVDNYLRLCSKGVSDGELIFVSGHPHRTDRLLPASVLRSMRDLTLPLRIEALQRQEQTLLEYASRGEENRRQAQEDLFFIQNSRKGSLPQLAVLRDGLVAQKQKQEDELRAQLRARPDLKHFDDAWGSIDQAEQARANLELPDFMFEGGRALGSWLFRDARQIVRLVEEDQKPDAQRLPEFTRSKRDELEQDLFAEYPFYTDLEIAKMTTSLTFMRDKLGPDDPMVKKILAGKEPAERAAELIHGTKLTSAAQRKRIYESGAAGVGSSDDALIQLARNIDPECRSIRREYEARVEEPQRQALTEINQARFALMGMNDYPDATGTLRLAFGVVKGYEQDGEKIGPWTTFAGALQHEKAHDSKDPYILPASWKQGAAASVGGTPLDFVCTADITGGNSGSPVINREGELVGVIFDSNRQGVPDNFTYSDKQARAVAVDSRAILQALRSIYGADRIVKELTGE